MISGRKKVLFAGAAFVGFFAAIELGLALCGVEPVLYEKDPYVGFASSIPLFIEERGPGGEPYLATAPGKDIWFNRQRFARRKPGGTFRIFSVGGSTTYGRPFTDSLSFSGWLRELLNRADRRRRWEVINAGGISYASYRVAALMEELARYEPDLFIIYTGHNEFLERRTYRGLIAAPRALRFLGGVLSRTRIYAAGEKAYEAITAAETPDRPPSVLDSEVSTILARSTGPADYTRDEEFRRQAIAHFRFNLNRMIDIARAAGAETILVTPAANLSDCSPFKSENRADLTREESRRFHAARRAARRARAAGDRDSERLALEEALGIDERYAELHYRLGKLLYARGENEEAADAFRRALDEDVCPLRAIEPIRRIVAETAERRGVPLVDFAALAEEHSAHGVPGAELFLDHVHLTLEGYRMLALALLEALESQGIARPAESWDEEALARVDERVKARLDRRAFGVSLRNLARVYAWAGKMEEAGRLARQAIEQLGDDAESHHIVGRSAAARGDREEAIEYFDRALEINPSYAEARVDRAASLLSRGRTAEAIRTLRNVLRVAPTSAEAHANLGVALASEGHLDEAVEHYRRALELSPESARVHNNLGLALVSLGDPRGGAEHFEQALRLRPYYSNARNNLGLALSSEGRFEEAAVEFREALRIRPRSAPAHYNLGAALHRMNRLQQAEAEYREALALNPDYAEAHFNLAAALVEGGRREEARRHLDAAVRIDPRFAAAAERLFRLKKPRSGSVN